MNETTILESHASEILGRAPTEAELNVIIEGSLLFAEKCLGVKNARSIWAKKVAANSSPRCEYVSENGITCGQPCGKTVIRNVHGIECCEYHAQIREDYFR